MGSLEQSNPPRRVGQPSSSELDAKRPEAQHDPAWVEEGQMIAAALGGDRAMFETIIARHQSAVFGYLRGRLLEPSDAEDLCQEVFLRWYLGHAPRPAGVWLRPWLIGVARNLLREHVRRVKRRKETGWTELCLRLDELVADETNDRFDEAMVHLPACLDSLGRSAREALAMRYQAQLRLGEIGQKLRRSEGAVKLLMFRSRQALRLCLETKTGRARQ